MRALTKKVALTLILDPNVMRLPYGLYWLRFGIYLKGDQLVHDRELTSS